LPRRRRVHASMSLTPAIDIDAVATARLSVFFPFIFCLEQRALLCRHCVRRRCPHHRRRPPALPHDWRRRRVPPRPRHWQRGAAVLAQALAATTGAAALPGSGNPMTMPYKERRSSSPVDALAACSDRGAISWPMTLCCPAGHSESSYLLLDDMFRDD
jgi:hypothetical protein